MRATQGLPQTEGVPSSIDERLRRRRTVACERLLGVASLSSESSAPLCALPSRPPLPGACPKIRCFSHAAPPRTLAAPPFSRPPLQPQQPPRGGSARSWLAPLLPPPQTCIDAGLKHTLTPFSPHNLLVHVCMAGVEKSQLVARQMHACKWFKKRL